MNGGEFAAPLKLRQNVPDMVNALHSRKLGKLAAVCMVGPEQEPNTGFTNAIDRGTINAGDQFSS